MDTTTAKSELEIKAEAVKAAVEQYEGIEAKVWSKPGVAPRVYIKDTTVDIGYLFIRANGAVGWSVRKSKPGLQRALRDAGIKFDL